MTEYPKSTTKPPITRNCLTFMEKHQLLKWMTKHLDFCKSKGMTGADAVLKAATELNYPVTVINAKNLWVNEAGRTWPFVYDHPGVGSPTVKSLAKNQKILAKALADLHQKLGSFEDLDPDVRLMAGYSLNDANDERSE